MFRVALTSHTFVTKGRNGACRRVFKCRNSFMRLAASELTSSEGLYETVSEPPLGAQGMKAIHQAGGHTLGQDAATCAVYGMRRACAELGILKRTAPISRIAAEILSITGAGKSSVLTAQ